MPFFRCTFCALFAPIIGILGPLFLGFYRMLASWDPSFSPVCPWNPAKNRPQNDPIFNYFQSNTLLFYSTNTPLGWTFVKPLLDQKTLDKIAIFADDFKSALNEEIDDVNIPKFLGGCCSCRDCMVDDYGPWGEKEYKIFDPRCLLTPIFYGPWGQKEYKIF